MRRNITARAPYTAESAARTAHVPRHFRVAPVAANGQVSHLPLVPTKASSVSLAVTIGAPENLFLPPLPVW